MPISPARQRNAVSEGMALGLVMLDRNELPFTNKMRIDLAFGRAWRDWADRYKSEFKQVSTDLAKGKDAVWVMTDAEKTKRTAAFYWEGDGGTLSIHGRQSDWDGDDQTTSNSRLTSSTATSRSRVGSCSPTNSSTTSTANTARIERGRLGPQWAAERRAIESSPAWRLGLRRRRDRQQPERLAHNHIGSGA
jgi:hypothetical protein